MESTIDLLRKAVVGVKVTPPQQHVLNHLYAGKKIVVVNQHRANGGEWMWIDTDENPDSICYAGSIYKAFWNLKYQIKKQTGNEFPLGKLFISDLNIKYNG